MGLLIKLQNGDTQLKSLKFGKDRPNGGDSKQPYIKKGLINDTVNPSLYNDFIVRGGIQAPLSALEDVARLTKYFADLSNPSGILFAAKQNILSRTGTKTEASKGAGYANGALNEGAYTPLSTLAEAGMVFAGGHIPKQGIDPVGLFPGLGINKYQDIIQRNQFLFSGAYEVNNRLIRLKNTISTNSVDFNFSGVKGYNLNTDIDSILLSYDGGADSNLGFGTTKIKFATGNDGTSRKAKSLYNPSSNTNLSFVDKTQTSLFKTWDSTQFNAQPLNIESQIAEDFRQSLEPTLKEQYTFLSLAPNYQTKNIETNFNLGNPGKKGNISSYTRGKRNFDGTLQGALDKINASPIYKSNDKDGSKYPGLGGTNQDPTLKDIVPFFIAILNNDLQVGGTYKKYMHFRAFIDSFSDSYNAEWNSISYMGRAEKFYKYGGFSREIDMSFTIVAQSREEITAMYDKLNFLASSLAPEYLDSYTSGYMAGNIAYITLGGYLNDQPGIITSLTFDVPEEATWEIGIDDEGNPISPEEIRQVPHMIKVTGIKFIPIHKFRPEKQTFVNDTLGTDSTRLLNTGEQRYIDQLRPPLNNYDKEAAAIAIRNQVNENTLVSTPSQPSNIDATLGPQQGLISQ